MGGGGKSDVVRDISIIDVGVWLSRLVLSILVPLATWYCAQINSKLDAFDKWQRKADTTFALASDAAIRSERLLADTRLELRSHEHRLSKIEYGCCGETKAK